MNAKELGQRIRTRRKALGFTLHEVARMTGLSYPTVRQIEVSGNNYRNDSLLRLLSVIDVEVAEKPVKKDEIDAEIVACLDKLKSITGINEVTITITGTDGANEFTKTYRK